VRWEPEVPTDLVLVSEVQARRILRDHRIRLLVLAPYGSWMGCGTLRVLRLRFDESDETCPPRSRGVEMTVGYEWYQA
jgi:hypothetical protein